MKIPNFFINIKYIYYHDLQVGLCIDTLLTCMKHLQRKNRVKKKKKNLWSEKNSNWMDCVFLIGIKKKTAKWSKVAYLVSWEWEEKVNFLALRMRRFLTDFDFEFDWPFLLLQLLVIFSLLSEVSLFDYLTICQRVLDNVSNINSPIPLASSWILTFRCSSRILTKKKSVVRVGQNRLQLCVKRASN